MDEELKHFREAEKLYTKIEHEFDEKTRATENCDSEILLLMLGEMKKTNELLLKLVNGCK